MSDSRLRKIYCVPWLVICRISDLCLHLADVEHYILGLRMVGESLDIVD